MKTVYTHLLLTRFNVRESEQYKLALDKQWLEYRFSLFDKYCFPSVQKQTNTDFKWILLFDKSTPECYKNLESKYQKQVDFELHFEYIDGWYDDKNLPSILYKYINPDSSHIVTSRIDNDDAISLNYMEEVKKRIEFNENSTFISFENGLQYFSAKSLLYKVKYKQNHFITLVEPLGKPFFSVLNYNHTTADKAGDFIVYNTTCPMWKEIVHGGNLLNDYTPVYKYTATNIKSQLSLQGMRLKYLFNITKKYSLVLSNYLYGTSATIANALISLLIYPYVIRALGIEKYGLYAFAMIIANTIIQIESTPFNLPFGKDVAMAGNNTLKKSEIFSTVMSAKLLLIASFSLIFFPVVILLPQAEPYRMLLIISYLSILGNPFMPNWYYQAIQKTKIIAYIQISIRLLSIPFILLLIKEPYHIIRFAIIYTASTLLCALVSFIYLKKKECLIIIFTPLQKSWQAIRRCVPTLTDTLSESFIKHLAGIMVGSAFGMVEMAYYDLANKLTQVISYCLSGINNALMPYVVSTNKRNMADKMIRYEILLGLLITALVVLIGKPAIWLLGGSEMEPAYLLTIILTIALLADFISDGIISLLLIPSGKLKEIPYGRYIALASFLLFCPFVSYFSYIYTILAILIASVLRFLYFCNLYTRKF